MAGIEMAVWAANASVDNDEDLRHNDAMIMRERVRAAAMLLFPLGLFAQQPVPQRNAGPLEFEVATIKPADPEHPGPAGSTGGPGTSDPGRISYRMTLRKLLQLAYEVTFEQLSGPDWLSNPTFDIMAKVSEGSTTGEVHVMLQHLLAERFRMTFHHELQDKLAYDLTVAKGGSKLKETLYPDAKPAAGSTMEFTLDKNDFPILPPDAAVQARVTWTKNGSMRSGFRAYSIGALAQDLAGVLAEATPSEGMVPPRVIDKTGLTGRYDFTLEYANFIYASVDDGVRGPSIFSAVEKQLGLKLEKTKAPLDVIVIDHIDKAPAEN
jgi:uncharacterized protein (TIGR03435 family)